MFLHPFRSSFATLIALDPLQEVIEDIGAHGMTQNNSLSVLRDLAHLDGKLQLGKVVVADLEIGEGETLNREVSTIRFRWMKGNEVI